MVSVGLLTLKIYSTKLISCDSQLQVFSSRNLDITLRSAWHQLLQEGGFRGMWRGNCVNVMKIVPESALKFAAYEQVSRRPVTL